MEQTLTNCKEYYTNRGNKFNGYLKDLQTNLNKTPVKTPVKKAVLDLAKKSLTGRNHNDKTARLSFSKMYNSTGNSFLKAITPAGKRIFFYICG